MTHGSPAIRSPGPHLLHGVHCGALGSSENVLFAHVPHVRTVPPPSSAGVSSTTYWPASHWLVTTTASHTRSELGVGGSASEMPSGHTVAGLHEEEVCSASSMYSVVPSHA